MSDTGRGIGLEHLSHIFQRFYGVGKARSTLAGHTGLGPAITKAVVGSHGGTIGVTSELGEGSRFTVRLPPLTPSQRRSLRTS